MVDGILTRCGPALLFLRRARKATLLAACLCAATRPAAAITLETYFLELNDRERGAYMTGFVELFANDAARDDAYRECVGVTGAAGLHEALSETVLNDPRMLTYEAVPWILYTAASLCKRPGAKPPPVPAVPLGLDAEAAKTPGGEGPAATELSGLQHADLAARDENAPRRDSRASQWAVVGALGGAVFGLLAAALIGRMRRRRS